MTAPPAAPAAPGALPPTSASPAAPAARGGAGQGGGLFTSGGTLSLSNDTFSADTATGGNGGNGGSGPIGAGAGGAGGAGQGGGFLALAPTSVTQSALTFVANTAIGGSGRRRQPERLQGHWVE